MVFFQNVKRDLGVLSASLLAIAVAWFGIPQALNQWHTYQLYQARSVVSVTLSQEDQKKNEQAIADIKNAIRNNDKQGRENYGQQYEKLGGHYETLGYLGKAASAYERSWKEGSKDNSILMSLARTYEQMRYYDKAISYYRQVIDRDPARVDTYQRLSDVYFYDLHNNEMARATYIDGLNKTGNNLDLMKLFANHLELAGNRHEAYIYWDAVLKKDSKNKTVADHLKTFTSTTP